VATKKGNQKKPPSAGAVAREYIEAIGRRDLEAAVAMWRPDAIDHFEGTVDLVAPEGVRAYFAELFAAFPDWSMEVLDVAGSRGRAAVRWRATGTFTGPGRFQGLAPTGAAIDIQGCDMIAVEDGEIVGNNAYVNGAQVAQQLGVLPPAGSFGERALTAAANGRTAGGKLLRRALNRP
jgi:steroid delta-isomerase-like uncharacterized protein